MINKQLKNLLVGSLGIFFIYKSYKYMASIEYMNNLTKHYEIKERIHKSRTKKKKEKKEDLEKSGESLNIIQVEPYVVISKDIVERISDTRVHELSYLELGNYLHEVGSL